MYAGPPMIRPSSSGRLTPLTPRSGSRSPSWPFMTDRQVMAARQFRRERHNLLEWMMTWVFVVTLAVVLLAILVFYASWQTRLDKSMQEHIHLLERLSQAPHFSSGVFKHLKEVDPPTEVHLRTLLKTISDKKYIAGTATISGVTNYIDTFMTDNKINHTKIFTYVVTMSHPDKKEKNRVQLSSGSRNGLFVNFELDEPMYFGQDAAPLPAYSAYGRAGTVQGQVFYANRCFPEDLDIMTTTVAVSSGVLLCRYSPTEGPGLAVATAQKYQALGVLLFGHPQDMSDSQSAFYPQTWWMSGRAIRRAHVRRSIDMGDPTTPGYSSRYPSTDVYREELEHTMLPTIPVQPINYDDAGTVLKHLGKANDGVQCPANWPSVPVGSVCKFSAGLTPLQVTMNIHNEIHESNIQNILAFFPGEVEPDRYVVFGVPLDSWGGGAVAPGSALAQALGLCYIINKQYTSKHHTWRPRRTIVFGGWDAHEFGDIGLTEFLEGSRHKIASRTVAYINSDICTTGPELAVTGSPVFATAFRNATKWVSHFNNISLYQSWYMDLHATSGESGQPELPMLRKKGSFVPFVDLTGVPSMDVAFKNKMTQGTYFPAMGTSYDTSELTDKFIDPNYQVHKMCRELLLALIWQWSEAVVLPYDLKELGARLSQEFNELNALYKQILDDKDLNLDSLSAAVKIFTSSLNHFEAELRSEMEIKNPLVVRRFNDKMMAVERCFVQEVDREFAPGKLRNVVYGPSVTDHERLVAYPVLRDLLEEFRSRIPSADLVTLKEQLRRQISLAVYALLQATQFIERGGLI